MTFLSNHNEGKATFMKAGKKAKAALCMLLACLCLAGCACAETVTLPDLRDFAGDMQVKILVNEPLRKFFLFSVEDDAISVAEAFVTALTEDCGFSISSDTGEFSDRYFGQRIWCLLIPDSTLPVKLDCHVRIVYSQSAEDSPKQVAVTWVDGISMKEPTRKANSSGGSAAGESGKTQNTTSPMADLTKQKANSSRKECDVCDGSGRCPDCGGERWVTRWEWVTEWIYVNGSPEQTTNSKLVTVRCDGSHCDNGLCSECGGDGWVND